MKSNIRYSCPLLPLTLLFVLPSFSVFSSTDNIQQQSIRVQQQQNRLEQQLAKTTDIHLSAQTPPIENGKLNPDEQPCIRVNFLSLKNKLPELSFLFPELMRRSGFKPGMCLGSNSIFTKHGSKYHHRCRIDYDTNSDRTSRSQFRHIDFYCRSRTYR